MGKTTFFEIAVNHFMHPSDTSLQMKIIQNGDFEMTAILRNTVIAIVAASSLAGSAMAGQQTIRNECDNTPTNKLWAGRCCGVGDANCLGGESHGHQGGDRGRGDNGRGTAGAK